MDGLLFDCDGVLAETEPDGHRVAFNQAFEEAGLPDRWSVDTYGALLETAGGRHRLRRFFGDRLDDAAVLALHQRKTDLFQAWVEGGRLPIRPGVAALIDEALAAGIKVGVCSTSDERAVRAVVAGLGPRRAGAMAVFAGEQAPRRKPDPAIYRLALDALGLDPTRTLAIEDSPPGLAAATAAGLGCLVTRSAYTRHEAFIGAAAVLDSLEGVRLDHCRAWLASTAAP
ncbi:HAD-IA family hydrolase [Pararhodospirillum oryzae]|uniref:Phosphatase n=1 Tax=Pararhodospirillum oryzae TaxID=478448 RepID=A0A512H7K7_9PROT|nr:HAD-IA family hydrolase [Pararhodospirillum oryzae]GEO81436.1 phosphatase [Pararhodospirillum oryzae]